MRLIVFDYDGTLVDSQAAIVSTMQAAFAEHGQAVPDAVAVRGIIGLSLERAIARLVGESTATESPLVVELAADYRRRFLEVRLQHGVAMEPLFSGMRDVLAAFDRPDRFLGIATGKNRRGLLHGLAVHELERHFTILKTADDGPSKPHPEILRQAMAEAAVAPPETVVIGDTVFDIEMARAAGAHALGVAWGYHGRADLLAAGAAGIAEDPEDLVGLVEEIACVS